MNIRTLKRWGWTVCVLLLTVIVGCQSVGGLNLNDMLVKQLSIEKQEQSLVLELEVDVNEALLASEDEKAKKAVELLRKLKLELVHSKADALGNQWVTGNLVTSKGSIPFTLHADEKAVRIDIDGAKRPFVLELSALQDELGTMALPSGEDRQAMMESVRKLAQNIGSYLIKGLPNPPVITVDQVNETIHGESTKLTKVHAELNGEQLGQLLPLYLENLIKDKEGFRATVVQVFEWLYEMEEDLDLGLRDSESLNAEAMANFTIETLLPELEDALEDLKKAQHEEEWKQIFDKGITLKTDLYVDESLHIRKSNLEAVIAPAAFAEEDSPIRSIKVRASSEMWNVNGEVEIPAVETPVNALKLEELDNYDAYRFVRMFDSDSVVYDLLKNDFAIDDQSFTLSSEWGIPFFVDEEGTAFVPLRETLGEFGIRPNLEVPANGPMEIRFYDRPTAKSIILRKDSDQATVNGETVKLAHPLMNDANMTYISADDLFGLLGAEYEVVEWEDYDEQMMEVTRDL
ncbi:hypothetical protein [Cohnella sp.]|uniref:hypothetical protein n=1 Tax=Cohnella sp. TaxID=1883426 RepID=UPI0037045A95